jgi:hypothetical protein
MSTGERQVGLHLIRWEPPDTIYVELVGELAEKEVHSIHAALEDLSRAGSIFLILNISRLGRMSPTARAAAARWPHITRIRAIATFGIGFEQRVLATLILKAVGLLSKDFTAAVAFFDREAEARVWCEGQRRRA